MHTTNIPHGYTQATPGAVTAEQMRGVDIYDSTGENVAQISDVEISPDGALTAVISDVGGFLGIGAKSVALKPNQINVYRNADGDLRAYVTATKDQLKAMPEYTPPRH